MKRIRLILFSFLLILSCLLISDQALAVQLQGNEIISPENLPTVVNEEQSLKNKIAQYEPNYFDPPWEGDIKPTSPETEDVGMAIDTDRNIMLPDSDSDSFPDLTESLEGTNPFDATNYPGSDISEELADPGFPAPNCRSGYRQAGSRLCISPNVHNARSYANAMVFCRDRRGRVASYGDLRYLYVRTTLDAAYNPNGRWIGNFVGDDTALCGNRSITSNNDPDIGNFEGQCNRFDSRNFWCVHDRE